MRRQGYGPLHPHHEPKVLMICHKFQSPYLVIAYQYLHCDDQDLLPTQQKDQLLNRFDEKGFFIVEKNKQVIASTWTKVHGAHSHDHGSEASHAHPAIGEIYITAVDPAHAGLGIGKVLTITALNYLKYQGLTDAMLYVDFDNKAALNLYGSLGFESSSKDVLYKYIKV